MKTVISQTRAQCGDNVQLFHMKVDAVDLHAELK